MIETSEIKYFDVPETHVLIKSTVEKGIQDVKRLAMEFWKDTEIKIGS